MKTFGSAAGLGSLGLLLGSPAGAQESNVQGLDIRPPMEEVVVVGRQRSAATDVVSERIEESVAMDLLSAEAIGRVGDSDAAAALQRVPGLTLVGGKFVYVRGLGERYSSAQLNGAQVPSPDLTRNVLPLDIFPADIIDALAVNKGYEPSLPAAFGGGNVDIRTKRVPEDRVFSFTIGTGWNTESGDDGLTYNGGDDDIWGTDDGTRALPTQIERAIQTYRGSFSPNNILATLRQDGGSYTIADAQRVNAELATALNRNVAVRDKSMDPDLDLQATAGYRWFLTDRLEFGFLALGSYDSSWRNRERTNRRITNPTTDFATTLRSTYEVDMTGNLGLGARWTSDHEVGFNLLFLRNTEDDANRSLTCNQGQFNDCFDPANPQRGEVTSTRYEERNLLVSQLSGEHRIGQDTLDALSGGVLAPVMPLLELAQGLGFEWYYSDSTAQTDLPNETRVSSVQRLDGPDGAALDSQIRLTTTAANFTFSDLQDEVDNWGWKFDYPFYGDGWDLELAAGYDYSRKGREYQQVNIGLGSTNPAFDTVNTGTLDEVFSNAVLLDPTYDTQLLLGAAQFGTESYFAAQTTEAGFGSFDLLLNDTWRVAGGVRYEEFVQVGLPVDPLAFDTSRIPLSPEEIEASIITTDDYYPSLAFTYIRPGFLADEFQLRLGWSETVARPDLREISESTFIDPLTEARVRGNPGLVPSDIVNYDIRAEWFWARGDQLTVSLFYKDIDQPIETVRGAATEDNILFSFINADTAETYGLELEGLKSLDFLSGFLGEWTETLYVSGNLTLSDSEIDLGAATGAGNLTNTVRRMTQHSEYVVNLQMGWDSLDNRHGLTLAFNTFGERIYYAGINGFDDAYQQPLDSLDLTYSWYPTDAITLKFKARNLLDDTVEIQQPDAEGNAVTVLEQQIGTTLSASFKWAL
jgi:TonB-dependent receptor